ncbi:hypothetical protein [Streptomyces griseoruber]
MWWPPRPPARTAATPSPAWTAASTRSRRPATRRRPPGESRTSSGGLPPPVRDSPREPALRGFVTGRGQAHDAVGAGLGLRYSSGAVEGHTNKIRMIARQMAGRADFDLLRKRILLAA